MKNIVLIFLFSAKILVSFSQEIEQEIPIFKEINPLTRQVSYQVTYRPAYFIPLSGTSSYINNGGINAIGFSFEYVLPKDWSFGLETGKQYFKKYYPRFTYDYDGTYISSAQMRTMRLIPLNFFANKYYANIDKTIRPYLQLGLGLTHVKYLTYWGYSPDEKNKWTPTLAPAIGLKVNLDETSIWVIDARVKYQIAPFKYDFISRINYFSADLSIGFRWWQEN